MILVGLATEDGTRAIVRRARELGLKASAARWITVGIIGGVDEWVGVEPVDGMINLCAPEPKAGRPVEVDQWLGPFGHWYAYTSDLVALRVDE